MIPIEPTLRFDLEVPPSGVLQLPVPLEAGSQVTVFVVENVVHGSESLLEAANSSIGFWDNPLDDEDWNDA